MGARFFIRFLQFCPISKADPSAAAQGRRTPSFELGLELLHQTAQTGYLRAHGYAAGWRLLSMEKVVPPEKVQSILKLEDDQPVLMIRRFRLADEDVIGLHRVYVPFPLAEGVKPEYLNQGESSLHYMEECMGLALSHSHRSVSAIPASEREANLLSVSVGSPLLQIERTTIGMDDMPVEYLRAVYRGDRFEYYLRLEHAGRGQRRPATLL